MLGELVIHQTVNLASEDIGGSSPSHTTMASWLIGKAMDCKSITDRFDSYTRLISKGKLKLKP